MSNCDCIKQDGYANCCMRKVAETQRDSLAARVKELEVKLVEAKGEFECHDEYLHECNSILGKEGIEITEGTKDGIYTLINQRDELKDDVEALESQCAAMREALDKIAAWDFLPNASQWPSMTIARRSLSSSAGSALLDRLHKAEAVVEAARWHNDQYASQAIAAALAAFDSEKGTK